MKIWCCVDYYDHGSFKDFIDFDSDIAFIKHCYSVHGDHFGEIMNAIYKNGVSPHNDAGVDHYVLDEDETVRYIFQRRYSNDLFDWDNENL